MSIITRASGKPAATARLQKPSTSAVSVRPSSPAFASQVASLAISASVMGDHKAAGTDKPMPAPERLRPCWGAVTVARRQAPPACPSGWGQLHAVLVA